MSALKNIWLFIKSDFARYGKKPTLISILGAVLFRWNHSFTYCFWLRLASQKNLFFHFATIKHRQLSKKYGIQIYPSTRIGYGLCLGHGINIVVNPNTIIGDNCDLCHSCTIGAYYEKAATIGNNVYISPHVCIIEDVSIGNNVTIGAGAVVVNDAPDNSTIVGVPAKVISYENPGRYVKNMCERYIELPSEQERAIIEKTRTEAQPKSLIDKVLY